MAADPDDPEGVIRRLIEATNRHDVDSMVGCFAEDYRNETPVHPGRSFLGRDQVRRNWLQILAAVPDVEARVLAWAVDGDVVWTEQEHRGTRPDGAPHVMRGVVIFRVAIGMVTDARFYLEPLDARADDVDDALRSQLSGA